MAAPYKESDFEAAIEAHLLDHGGWIKGDPAAFDSERCLDPSVLLSFIRETQPDEWAYLENLQKDRAEATLLDDLCRALDSDHEGCLTVIRRGFKCFGKTFRVAFFRPATGLNPETLRRYDANKLTVTRQVKYSPNHNNTLDVVLSLNGLPIATAELKNPSTGQSWEHAERQYRKDRSPKDKMFQFKKRTLVHFAVDPDIVRMTTRLAGSSTRFLPFNKGNGNAAGNPENPNGHRTSYLWEEVWARNSFLDIVARFIHLQIEEKEIDGNKIKKETMIFPRYHQLDCVRKLVADAREKGAGTNYLIQHSAGSGKSNSIAWLAHRLAGLHNAEEARVFDSVIVVTDRIVLDRQLQDTIYQFDHRQGVVQKIDQDSTQLAEAIVTGVPIIITTLQKFPYVTEKIEELEDKRYAVIVDEAHSSQGGEAAIELKGVLAADAIEKEIAARRGGSSVGSDEADKKYGEGETLDVEEGILRKMLTRSRQPNLSFFAFTATPKYRTLEVFGHTGPDGKPAPFHLYSMRQAIEEGFILDVLKGYTSYRAYYRLVKSIEEDPKVDKRKAAKALARFMSLHAHNISQKTEVMVEHFRTHTQHKIGGRAKAMVVTSSRLAAVKYKLAFDKYIREKGYDIRTLVAFSGEVMDPDVPGVKYTEVGMNGGQIKESELRGEFAKDEYKVLIVAEKYQTGFDEPLLHTMYVDKRLGDVQAVQTLSRLNRTCDGKEDTFVLDFVNEPEEIQKAFQPYYEQTEVGERVEPGQLYELQARLDNFQVYYREEVEAFARIFFKPREKQSSADHGRMEAHLAPAVDRYRALGNDEKNEFLDVLTAFRNLYGFLSQIIPFQDSDLEKLYAFVRFLSRRLKRPGTGESYELGDDVALKYYRLQKLGERDIELLPGSDADVSGPTDVGTGKPHDEQIELSELIGILNDRFGTEFKPADQLFFDSIREDAVADSELRQAALANSMDHFGFVFGKALEGLFIDRMEQNEEITARFLNETDFKKAVEGVLLKQVYDQIREQATA